jgi:hypothetical protein
VSWYLILGVLLAVVFATALEFAARTRLRRYFDRPCAGIQWHRSFPDVPHDEIRAFLRMFAESFAIDVKYACRLSPVDQLKDIYLARYVPHLTLDDHMEFESLVLNLEDRYGVKLEAVFHETLTLGELLRVSLAPES